MVDIPRNKKEFSDETRKVISEKRKAWLKNNPDKHPWRNKDKFKSNPCERVKEYLKNLNISFIEEYPPNIEGRFFSIDIALPDKMIAIEINGNQHYEKDGSLKPYYQERHDLLEKEGWAVYQVHYTQCFNFDKWVNFSKHLLDVSCKNDFDYFNYKPIQKEKIKNKCVNCSVPIYKTSIRCKSCCNKERNKEIDDSSFLKNRNYLRKPKTKNNCECGCPKLESSPRCVKCSTLRTRKVDRPSKEELSDLVWQMALTNIGKKYGVSDNAVRKWCKTYGIKNLPPRHYFITKDPKKLNEKLSNHNTSNLH